MDPPKQSAKGLRIATRCQNVEEFVQSFHRFCEDSGVFISHARRSLGEVVAFSFDLADGSPALSGVGAVLEQFTAADNRFGRPGVVVALERLTRDTRRVFEDLQVARATAQEEAGATGGRSPTPTTFAQARTFTSAVPIIDREALTPLPGAPPRSPDARHTPPKPHVVQMPADGGASVAAASTEAFAPTIAAPLPVAATEVAAPAPRAARVSSPPIKLPGLPPPPGETVAPEDPVAERARPSMPRLAAVAAPPAPAMPALAAPPMFDASPPMFGAAPQRGSVFQRWSARRIWLVAAIAGASLLSLGLVIGAKLGGGARPVQPGAAAATSPSPAVAAPSEAAPHAPAADSVKTSPSHPRTAAEVRAPAPRAATATAKHLHEGTKAPARSSTSEKKAVRATKHKSATKHKPATKHKKSCTSLDCM